MTDTGTMMRFDPMNNCDLCNQHLEYSVSLPDSVACRGAGNDHLSSSVGLFADLAAIWLRRLPKKRLDAGAKRQCVCRDHYPLLQ
jgi:hypothetical protein